MVESTHQLTMTRDRVVKRFRSWDKGEPEREWAGLEVLHRYTPGLAPPRSRCSDCPEEPRIGPPGSVDVEIRFRRKSHLAAGELDVVIEVRAKLFENRVQDKQRRVDLIRDRLSSLGLRQAGVWSILAEGE